MREYGIGACGTARHSVIPEALQIDKISAHKQLEWNDLFGVVEDGVLCGLWKDSTQVYVMSTIHDLQTGTMRLRRPPKGKGLDLSIPRAASFGEGVS